MGQPVSVQQPWEQNAPLLVYSPLPSSTSIRLVQLDDMNSDEDNISLFMKTVDLDATDEYWCLSYTWGRPCTIFTSAAERDEPHPGNKQIMVNGAVHEIGSNAFEFLKVWRYRKMSLSKVPEWMWIDTITINQSDPEERSIQVALMARIFRQAHTVLVWLGPTDGFCETALELMKKVAASRCAIHFSLPPAWSSAWLNLYAFLQRSWFTRLWVIQEVIVAQRLRVLVGRVEITWTDIVFAAETLDFRDLTNSIYSAVSLEMQATTDDINLDIQEPGHGDDSLWAWGTPRRLFCSSDGPDLGDTLRGEEFILLLQQLREQLRLNPESKLLDQFVSPYLPRLVQVERSTLFLLQSMQRTDCTDPRDRVYAFIDLLERVSICPEDVSPLRKPIIPDYTTTLDQVYTNMAWYVLLSEHNLDLLSFASGSENKLSGLPSWVPDWRNRTSIAARVLSAQKQQPNVPKPKGGGWLKMAHVFAYSPLLQVEGRLFSVISDVAANPKGYATEGPYILWPTGELIMRNASLPMKCDSVSLAEILLGVLTLSATTIWCHSHANKIFHAMWMAEYKRATWEWKSSDVKRQAELRPILDIYQRGLSLLFLPPGRWMDREAGTIDIDMDEEPPESLRNGQFFRNMGILSRLQATSQNNLPGDIRCQIERMEDDVQKTMRDHPEAVAVYSAGRYDIGLGIPVEEIVPWSLEYHKVRRLQKTMTAFKTNGHHFGNGPRALRPGDQVWLISGTRVPMILRPIGQGRWRVVGEAYVNGLMDNSAECWHVGETQNIILE